MRTVPLLRPVLAALCLGAVLVAAPACKKASSEVAPAPVDVAAEGVVDIPEAIVEENDNGSVAWSIASDGQLKAVVKSTDGKPITKNITGELLWKGPNGDEKIPVALDKTGYVVASGPKLQDDLTEITYNLQVESKPWLGTLHVPRGGTLDLQESANVSVTVPEGKVGPNGGVIQVVGEDRVEVVADKSTGQVRAYFLDPEFKVIKGPNRKVRIAIAGETPEVIILEPEPTVGLYFVGRARTRVDPVRLTVAVTNQNVTHTRIVGFRPHTRLVVGARAPRVKFLVASGWEPDVDVRVRTRAPTVIVNDHDDRVRVKLKGRGHHDGRVHAGAGAAVGVGVGVGVAVAVPRPPPPPSIRVGVGVGVHAGAGVQAGAGAHAGGGVRVKGKGRH
jgi:hypothetical protein